jgi:hypothetical protein
MQTGFNTSCNKFGYSSIDLVANNILVGDSKMILEDSFDCLPESPHLIARR